MKIVVLILVPLACVTTSWCQHGIAGLYKSNFAVYGAFVEELQLNCDSTFEYKANIDFTLDTIKGKWAFKDAHILVLPDTASGNGRKLAGKKWFYKDGRLLALSPADYNNFVADILRMKDSLKTDGAPNMVIDIPEPNTALAGGYGKLKPYYLQKINGANCH